MAKSARIEYTLLYEDDTTQKLSVGPYNYNYLMQNSNIATIKTNIQTFLNDSFDSDVSRAAVSKYGANWAGFSKVQIIGEDQTVYF